MVRYVYIVNILTISILNFSLISLLLLNLFCVSCWYNINELPLQKRQSISDLTVCSIFWRRFDDDYFIFANFPYLPYFNIFSFILLTFFLKLVVYCIAFQFLPAHAIFFCRFFVDALQWSIHLEFFNIKQIRNYINRPILFFFWSVCCWFFISRILSFYDLM